MYLKNLVLGAMIVFALVSLGSAEESWYMSQDDNSSSVYNFLYFVPAPLGYDRDMVVQYDNQPAVSTKLLVMQSGYIWNYCWTNLSIRSFYVKVALPKKATFAIGEGGNQSVSIQCIGGFYYAALCVLDETSNTWHILSSTNNSGMYTFSRVSARIVPLEGEQYYKV